VSVRALGMEYGMGWSRAFDSMKLLFRVSNLLLCFFFSRLLGPWLDWSLEWTSLPRLPWLLDTFFLLCSIHEWRRRQRMWRRNDVICSGFHHYTQTLLLINPQLVRFQPTRISVPRLTPVVDRVSALRTWISDQDIESTLHSCEHLLTSEFRLL